MKVTAKIGEKLVFEVEEKSQTDVFEQVATLQEVFGNSVCGACGSSDIKYIVREDKEEHKYYEMACQKCRAKLSFGQHKKGQTLFPKRKDGDKWLENQGWVVYKPQKES